MHSRYLRAHWCQTLLPAACCLIACGRNATGDAVVAPEPTPESAHDYANRLRDQGGKDGCLVLGKYFWQLKGDVGSARAPFLKACELGSSGGCQAVELLGLDK